MATGATVVVAAVALVVALVVNASVANHLVRNVDARLTERLATAAASPATATTGTTTPPTPGAGGGDVDDVPAFVWRVGPTGTVLALDTNAPSLPSHHWSGGTVDLATVGSTFRYASAPSDGGWLVAGESVIRVGQVRGDLILAEVLLGALLLLVTFTGSFVVGLRASAPIEQIRRRQAEFTADASHELRTPLSVIEAEVDLALSRDRNRASYQATLRRIASESGRLRAIVEDLLWLARTDAPATEPVMSSQVDVAAVTSACASRFAAVADGAAIEFSVHARPNAGAVIRAESESIDRLVSVLVDNACRYAGHGGGVDVAVTRSGGRVVLTVDDSGPGIPEDQRELVFDRFHRVDPTPGGTGLGLAIADAVVRASSGRWSLGSSPLGGARFEVSWRHAAAPAPVGDAQAG